MSHLGKWRRTRARGQLDGLQPQRRGREPEAGAGLREEVWRLRCERGHLDASLAQADAIIEVQDKVSQLPGLTPLEDGMR